MVTIQRSAFASEAASEPNRSLERKRKYLHWDPFLDSYLTDVASRIAPVFIPSFDIRETAEGYRFLADLPGIEPPDLDVKLKGQRLEISGERRPEPLGEDENVFAAERTVGTFCRTFNLPDNIDPDQAKADLHNGVLSVWIPKRTAAEGAQARTILVSDGNGNGQS